MSNQNCNNCAKQKVCTVYIKAVDFYKELPTILLVDDKTAKPHVKMLIEEAVRYLSSACMIHSKR